MRISQDHDVQTVMVTYDVSFGTYEELMGILSSTYKDHLAKQDGFIGAAIHVNEAKTRVASYSQWDTREHFLSVLRSEHMQAVNRKLADLSKGFEPVLYEIKQVYSVT
ncbi:MAG: antibiotic biosynthesis monooxygenase [Nitratireductor sp.]|nr:antibiotic biosynthesis monooxygenase [Nitratireductor sp.]